MTSAIARKSSSDGATLMEQVLVNGDLGQLTPDQRLKYYNAVCESVGLNPLTRPFEYIVLNGKLTLYAKRDCTDQLRKMHGVTIAIISRENVQGVYAVTARGTTPDGRSDEAIGAVPLVKEGGEWRTGNGGRRYFDGNGTYVPLSPDELANAIMKAETKAKRRVTLSLCGLGILDETELETIPPERRHAADDDDSALPPGPQSQPTRRTNARSAPPPPPPATEQPREPSEQEKRRRGEWLIALAGRGASEHEATQLLDAMLRTKKKSIDDITDEQWQALLSKAGEGGYDELLRKYKPSDDEIRDGEVIRVLMEGAAKRHGLPSGAGIKAWELYVASLGYASDESKISLVARHGYLAAARAGAIDWATGKKLKTEQG